MVILVIKMMKNTKTNGIRPYPNVFSDWMRELDALK